MSEVAFVVIYFSNDLNRPEVWKTPPVWWRGGMRLCSLNATLGTKVFFLSENHETLRREWGEPGRVALATYYRTASGSSNCRKHEELKISHKLYPMQWAPVPTCWCFDVFNDPETILWFVIITVHVTLSSKFKCSQHFLLKLGNQLEDRFDTEKLPQCC